MSNHCKGVEELFFLKIMCVWGGEPTVWKVCVKDRKYGQLGDDGAIYSQSLHRGQRRVLPCSSSLHQTAVINCTLEIGTARTIIQIYIPEATQQQYFPPPLIHLSPQNSHDNKVQKNILFSELLLVFCYFY